MFRAKKDDIVYVISGKDKGKTGKVLKVFPFKNRAIVEGINFAKKHVRRTQEDQKTGVIQIEMPIDLSNLMSYCKRCNRPVRIGITKLKDGTKTRYCRLCKEVI